MGLAVGLLPVELAAVEDVSVVAVPFAFPSPSAFCAFFRSGLA